MSKIQVKKLNSELEPDSDSDMDLDDLAQSRVDVGYIDTNLDELNEKELQLYRIRMKSPFFPCKVGGKPAWLDYVNVPLAVGAGQMTDSNNNKSSIELQCLSCKSQLVFLLQIYAPIGGPNDQFCDQAQCLEDAFHRVLYVFLCSNQGCKSRTFKVYRSQLNRENDFFSYDPPPQDYEEDDIEQELYDSKDHLKKFYLNIHKKNMLNQCAVCGLACSKKCSRCNFSFFCSQNHQIVDWTKLNHKSLCSKYSSPDVDKIVLEWVEDENSQLKCLEEKNSTVFPEREILIEPEVIDIAKLKKEKDKFKYDEKSKSKPMVRNIKFTLILKKLRRILV